MTTPARSFSLWNRTLLHYPDKTRRHWYLGIVVIATIVLYYQQYVGGAVSPSVLAHFQISFRFYLNVVVISSAAGALSSLLAGLADRWGRANLVVWGLLGASLVTCFGIPSAPNADVYAVYVSLVGFVEGAVLVATPALVRDFSPQAGRGVAMGIWTLGPVIGSLIVSEVASNTLDHLHAWQDQFHIAGLAGLAVFLLALFTLRELSPGLRDQLMVSIKERVLVEARARGIDVATVLHRPWRQMFRMDIVLPAFGISCFLLIYYAAVGFFVVYFTSVYGFSQSQANALGNWFWAADAVTVVIAGTISDRLGVRKPLMVAGIIGAIIMTIIFASKATHPATSYGSFIVIISLLSSSRGLAYAPWMASFTETIERRNPALVATGIAIWAWVLRAVVAVSFLVIPYVVTSATPIVEYGPRLLAISAKYAPQIATLEAIDPNTLARLRANQSDHSAISTALKEIKANQHVGGPQAIENLISIRSIPIGDRDYLNSHGKQVQAARKSAPGQWQHWWWVCIGGELVFLPTIFLLIGRWRPSAAKADRERRRKFIESELSSLDRELASSESE